MPAADILAAEGLSVQFGGVRAVDGIDLEIRRGQILGLIGPNGAGKTTIINALTGFQRATAGRVSLGTRDVTRASATQMPRLGVARTFQGVRTFRGLSVLQNIELGGVAAGLSRREARTTARSLLSQLKLADQASMPAGSLPHGDERRVGIGRALALKPDFLLLDEPVAGLNAKESEEVAGLISWIRTQSSCGVLVVEHNVKFIMGLCDRIQVLSLGRTVSEGTPTAIRDDPAVIAAYLGGGFSRRPPAENSA
jgi:branched-chain amino acid transport system ATP-binding protein